jgi:glutamyl-tRNA synthetase
VRVEDLDAPRTVPAAVAGNLAELRWLGLDWDEGPDVGGPHAPYRQSERGEHYQAALARLRGAGPPGRGLAVAPRPARGGLRAARARRARCTDRRSGAQSDAAARAGARARLPGPRRARGTGAPSTPPCGRRRGRSTGGSGVRRFDLARDVGDVVVRRSDGLWAYALAVVVDDAAMGITEVVRGDDLLAGDGRPGALAAALGLPSPTYAHAPAAARRAGARMAKRRGGATLAALRAGGADPRRVVGALAVTLGWLARRARSPRATCWRGATRPPGRTRRSALDPALTPGCAGPSAWPLAPAATAVGRVAARRATR